MSFGIGFGAFAQGLAGGLNTGLKLGNALEAGANKRAMKGAIDDARKDYDGDIANKVLAQAGEQAGLGQPFDAEAATKKARAENPFMDFLYKNKMPEIIDSMVTSGDLAGAEKMRQWAEDGKERKFMEGFGRVLAAGAAGRTSGDYKSFADQSMKLFNSGGYGMTITGYDFIKGEGGETAGITYKIKGEDGKETPLTFNSMEEANQFIAGNANPTMRFKQWVAEGEAATKLRAETAKERMKAAVGLGKEVAVENVRQNNRKELDDHKTDNQMRRDATTGGKEKVQQQRVAEYRIDKLREAGFSDERIQELMPSILGVTDTRKKASPEERVQSVRRALMNDIDFSRKTQAEQNQIIRDVIKSDDEIAAEFSRPAASPAPAPRPKLNVFQ